MTVNNTTVKPANGAGIFPYVCRLTYIQEVPIPNIPQPKRNPRQAARRGEQPIHSQKRTAGNNTPSGNNLKGANARGKRAPAKRQIESSFLGVAHPNRDINSSGVHAFDELLGGLPG
jgi:hypothetical protein